MPDEAGNDTRRVGQPFVIGNRPGASGTLGMADGRRRSQAQLFQPWRAAFLPPELPAAVAIPARCCHARVRGLSKDNCRFVYGKDPDGMGFAALRLSPQHCDTVTVARGFRDVLDGRPAGPGGGLGGTGAAPFRGTLGQWFPAWLAWFQKCSGYDGIGGNRRSVAADQGGIRRRR